MPHTDRVGTASRRAFTGASRDAAMALDALRLFADAGPRRSSKIALSAVPCGNPGGPTLRSGPSMVPAGL